MNIFDIEININELFYDKLIFNQNMHEFIIDKSIILENNMIFQIIF